MSKRSILVVDDDRSVRSYLSDFLTSCGYSVECLESGDQAVARLAAGFSPSLIVLDIIMPGISGIEVLENVKKTNANVPVIILSAVGQTKTVVDAMKMGASDFLVKPFEEQELELAIENVFEKQKLKEEVKDLKRQLDQYNEQGEFLSTNPKMLKIREIAKHVSDTDVPVLLLGESGVGKEVLARFLHTNSSRRDKPFIKVNCAALPNELLESELFGYEKGAFTGAINEKPGKFELADKGTILLDEIGEMTSHLQAKLLHVLQDSEYSRLGGKRLVRVDARVLATTNVNLEEAVANGKFREDLYFRLNVIRLDIPPLRERREDIPILCNYFLYKYRERYKSNVEQLSPQLLDCLLRYDWPGNIRQLENAIKRYLILPDVDMTLAELKEPAGGAAAAPVKPKEDSMSLKDVGSRAAEQAEKELVLRVLEETSWNRKQAARRLNICYKALLNKLKRWQIDNRNSVQSALQRQPQRDFHALPF
ncbi:MAG: sigma-54-dependent Fis family transcriptional regulator [Acidobacteria bacterium]|nr:sigma-54-dependent Fis family transcriptional regulator [Acidobacteriota bacterium]